jgi:membrane protease YdiL (CAAX protease family)
MAIAVEHHPPAVPGLRGLVARHPIASFLTMTYALNVAFAIPSVLTRRDILPFDQAIYDWLGHLVGTALPAFLVVGAIGGRAGVRDLARRSLRWRVPLRWYAVAVLGVPVLTLLGGLAFYGLEPLRLVAENWSILFTDFLPHLLLVIVFSNVAEEIGWTGFLFERLQGRFSPMKASLVVAVPFALAHVTGYVVEEGLSTTPLLFAVLLIPQAASRVIAAWFYNNASRSVLIVGIFHCAFNVTGAAFADEFLPGTNGEFFVLSSAIIILSAVGIAIATRGRLGNRAA